MDICDVIRELFSSEDMQEYLCKNSGELTKWQRIDMIEAAPIPIQRKMEIFNALTEQENLDDEIDEVNRDESIEEEVKEEILKMVRERSYSNNANTIRLALEALHDVSTGVFLLKVYMRVDEESDEVEVYDTLPVSSYEKAIAYMEGNYIKEEVPYFWGNLTKWEPDVDGNLKETWQYTIVDGQIIFFANKQYELWEICKQDESLNLPVPFQMGDIIEVECMPFAGKHHALILSIGDNEDCCCVRELHVTEKETLAEGALKHGGIFSPNEFDATSPLYSAKRYNGKLSGKDEVLTRIQNYMRNRVDLNEDFWQVFRWERGRELLPEEITEAFLDVRYKEISENNQLD